jgi:hypothetical protein
MVAAVGFEEFNVFLQECMMEIMDEVVFIVDTPTPPTVGIKFALVGFGKHLASGTFCVLTLIEHSGFLKVCFEVFELATGAECASILLTDNE